MDASGLVAVERTGIADDLLRYGPDAPTLCEGWTTLDLVTHLVIREHDPVAAAGILLPGPFEKHLDHRMETVKAEGFGKLVERFRAGPGIMFKALPVANVNEYFIHHEDIRRANGEGPRDIGADYERALWKALGLVGLQAKLKVKHVGLVIDGGAFGRRVVRDADPGAVIAGPPSELSLYFSGRQDHAEVEITGSPDAITALEKASFGL